MENLSSFIRPSIMIRRFVFRLQFAAYATLRLSSCNVGTEIKLNLHVAAQHTIKVRQELQKEMTAGQKIAFNRFCSRSFIRKRFSLCAYWILY